MTRALFSWPSVAGLALYAATLGCNSATAQPPLLYPAADPQLSPHAAAAAPIHLVVNYTTWNEGPRSAPSEGAFEEAFLPMEETIVTVDADSVAESSRALLFTPALRGEQPVGVRIYFATEQESEGETHLGLRHADRVEEIDGLPVLGLDAFLPAWRSVGVKPEVRFSISRAGRPLTLIYRRRAPGMLLAY